MADTRATRKMVLSLGLGTSGDMDVEMMGSSVTLVGEWLVENGADVDVPFMIAMNYSQTLT